MRARATLILGSVLAVAGCAGHASTMRDVRASLLRNDLEGARARLAEAGRGTDDLLFALEDGLLLYYAGDPALSISRFDYAEGEVEERYTKSITRAALSLVTSDLILQFDPNGLDNLLVNYYKALAYIDLGDIDGAWVEWRRLESKLQFSRSSGDAAYLDPPFFSYLAGLGLEADDRNAAYIDYRLAEEAYRAAGIAPPRQLVGDLLRLGTELGFSEHLDLYRARYGALPGTTSGYGAGNGHGSEDRALAEVVVLVEDGLVAPIEEVRAFIPITRERAKHVHDGGKVTHLDLAEALALEYRAGQYRDVSRGWANRVEIEYVLSIALPVFGKGRPALRRLTATAASERVAAEPVLDVSALQRAAFEDRLLGIYAKTIARALVKYAAAAKLKDEAKGEDDDEDGEESEGGEVVGVLANIVNALTERADTRAWLGLPHRIWMARLQLLPGTHEIKIDIDGIHEVSLGTVELTPGERRFLSHRVF